MRNNGEQPGEEPDSVHALSLCPSVRHGLRQEGNPVIAALSDPAEDCHDIAIGAFAVGANVDDIVAFLCSQRSKLRDKNDPRHNSSRI